MIERIAPSAGDQVRRFLIESERRVIVHCRKLLDDQNLPTEDHRRLMRFSARQRQGCKTFLHKRQCKINRGKLDQIFFLVALEIDSGFSNSIFAAFGGAGRQLLGPAD
jgi:hypothetical protein